MYDNRGSAIKRAFALAVRASLLLNARVPDVIQSLWIGSALGPLERLSAASFMKQGHEYHLYTYGPLENVPPGVVVIDGNEILPASSIFSYQSGFGSGSVSAFSNLFRYKLLLERGGWWADADVVCLRAFDFAEPLVLAGEYHRNHPRQIASAVIRSPSGHVLMQKCYNTARESDPAKVVWGQIGPLLLSSVAENLKLEAHVRAPEVFCPVPWWEWEVLVREDGDIHEWISSATYAIHLWHELWRSRRIDRNMRFPDSAPISRLLADHGIAAS